MKLTDGAGGGKEGEEAIDEKEKSLVNEILTHKILFSDHLLNIQFLRTVEIVDQLLRDVTKSKAAAPIAAPTASPFNTQPKATQDEKELGIV